MGGDEPTIEVTASADVATSTEYMQLTDAPSLLYANLSKWHWINMLTGVNYEVTDDLQTRFIPDATAIAGQNGAGTTGAGTPARIATLAFPHCLTGVL